MNLRPWENPYYVQFCQCVSTKYVRSKPNNSLRTNFLNVLEYQKKCLIVPKKIRISRELRIPPELQNSYIEICTRIKNGTGVAPFLSNDASKMKWDQEFSESKILHLHFTKIGEVPRKKRGKSTLRIFVPENSNTVYILRVEHTHKGESWLNMVDEQIIENNWPSLLPKLTGITPQKVTGSERANYGKMHVGIALGVIDKNNNPRAIIPNLLNMQGLTTNDMNIDTNVVIPFFQNLYSKYQAKDYQLISSDSWFGLIKVSSDSLPKVMLRIDWNDFWKSLILIPITRTFKLSARLTIEPILKRYWDLYLNSNLLTSKHTPPLLF